jgi:NAD dependent epimerase/dehydratase family enzyme
MVGVFVFALDNPEARGPLNGTAPNPVTNKEFSKALGRALHRPAVLPMPGFALRLMLGEVAQIIASGQRVVPKRTLALGYKYEFPHLDAALADIVR